MNVAQLWVWLVATAAMTVAAIILGAAMSNQALAALAGGLFTLVAMVAGWRFAAVASDESRNPGEGWNKDQTDPQAEIAARFARVIALAWAWAGAAMLGAYYLTALSWQHAWQYGLAMLLIAAGLVWYAGRRSDPAGPWARPDRVRLVRVATALQGLAAIVSVLLLSISGKVQPDGRDWAANIVFIAGGLALFSLSMAALRAERRA